MNDTYEDKEPHGFIECDGELMGFWLPDDIEDGGIYVAGTANAGETME